jgi:hypothetical protein
MDTDIEMDRWTADYWIDEGWNVAAACNSCIQPPNNPLPVNPFESVVNDFIVRFQLRNLWQITMTSEQVGRGAPCAPVLADRHARAGVRQGTVPALRKSSLCLLRLVVAFFSFNRS